MNKVLMGLAQGANDTSVFDISLEMANAFTAFRSSTLSVYRFSEWFGIDEEGPIGSFNLNLVVDRMGGQFYFLLGVGDGYACFEEGERLADMSADPVIWLEELTKIQQPMGEINDPNNALHMDIQRYPDDFKKLIDRVREFRTYMNMDLNALTVLQERREDDESPF